MLKTKKNVPRHCAAQKLPVWAVITMFSDARALDAAAAAAVVVVVVDDGDDDDYVRVARESWSWCHPRVLTYGKSNNRKRKEMGRICSSRQVSGVWPWL